MCTCACTHASGCVSWLQVDYPWNERTALQMVTAGGNCAVMKVLIDHGANVNYEVKGLCLTIEGWWMAGLFGWSPPSLHTHTYVHMYILAHD